MNILLVLTTLPEQHHAKALAAALVEARHAACATLMPAALSVYRWQGVVESAEETLLLLKTTAEAYPALEAAIRAAHPYEVPEILAFPASAGLQDYLAWVRAETQAATSPGSPSAEAP